MKKTLLTFIAVFVGLLSVTDFIYGANNRLTANSEDKLESLKLPTPIITKDGEVKVCDSTICYNFESDEDSSISYKYEYEYTLSGKVSKSYTYIWDDDLNGYYISSKEENTYDENDSLILWQSFNWDDATDDWENGDKRGIVYDENGYILEAYYARWDDDGNYWAYWSKSWREVNDDGQITKMRVKTWDYDEVMLKYYSGYDKEYDDDGNLTTHIIYTRYNDGDTLIETKKHEYEYDANNNQTQYIYSTWDNSSSAWVLSDKVDQEYSSDNEVTKTTELTWDEDNSVWENYYRTDIVYCAQSVGLDSIMMCFQWDDDNAVWDSTYKNEYKYDEKDRQISIHNYKWTTEANGWEIQEVVSWSYDDDNNKASYYFSQDLNYGVELVKNIDYTYDDEGRIIDQLTYQLVSGWGVIETEEQQYAYDKFGNKTVDADITYNKDLAPTGIKYEYVYDSENNLISLSNSSLNTDGSTWSVSSKYFYYYSTNYILKASDNSFILNADKVDNAIFQIISNVSWTISEDAEWLSLSTYSGSGSDSVSISVDENNSGDSRTATLVLEGDYVNSFSLEITQESYSNILNNNAALSQFYAYPNPTDGVITLQSKNNEDFNFEVLDLSGKVLKAANTVSGSTIVDLSDLNSHIFFLRINSEKYQETIRIIKQ